jgi:predicted DNA-binding transcriptional regulator AlpA
MTVPPVPPHQRSPYDPASGRPKPLKQQVKVTTALPHQRQGDRAGEPEDVYLTSNQVMRRYGDASRMWIFRRLRDDDRFPKPLVVAGRRLWKLSDLVAWERQAAASA